MSEQLDLNHNPELRALTAERDQLRAEVEELKRALDAARQELRDKAAITAERDLYLRQLEDFWSKEIAEMDKNGVDFGEIIAEIEQAFRARGLLDGK